MVTTVSGAKILSLCVLALALALAALLLMRPQIAQAAHEDCTLSSGAPISYGGILVIASGSVECTTVKNVIRITVALTRDGVAAGSAERTCHHAASCPTYLFVNDPPGDQLYCSQVSARVGPHSMAEPVRCEAAEVP